MTRTQTEKARQAQIRNGRSRQLDPAEDRQKEILFRIGAFRFSTTSLLVASGATHSDIVHLSKSRLILKSYLQYRLHDRDRGQPVCIWGLTKYGVKMVRSQWEKIDPEYRAQHFNEIDYFDFRYLDFNPQIYYPSATDSHDLIVQAATVHLANENMSIHCWGTAKQIHERLEYNDHGCRRFISNTFMGDLSQRHWPDAYIRNQNGNLDFIEVEKHRKTSAEYRIFFQKIDGLAGDHNKVWVICATEGRKDSLLKTQHKLIEEGLISRSKNIHVLEIKELPLILPGTVLKVRDRLIKNQNPEPVLRGRYGLQTAEFEELMKLRDHAKKRTSLSY